MTLDFPRDSLSLTDRCENIEDKILMNNSLKETRPMVSVKNDMVYLGGPYPSLLWNPMSFYFLGYI